MVKCKVCGITVLGSKNLCPVCVDPDKKKLTVIKEIRTRLSNNRHVFYPLTDEELIREYGYLTREELEPKIIQDAIEDDWG